MFCFVLFRGNRCANILLKLFLLFDSRKQFSFEINVNQMEIKIKSIIIRKEMLFCFVLLNKSFIEI